MTTTLVCATCLKPVERTLDDDFQHVTTDDGLACTAWPVHGLRADFTPGDKAIWTGTKRLFEQQVTITAIRNAYLTIAGEQPGDGTIVYDIDASPQIKGTVFSIPAGQLQALEG